MIVPVLSWLSNAKDASYMKVRDITGAYDNPDNLGGYGAPNEAEPTVVGFRGRYWPDTAIYGTWVTDDAGILAALFGSDGYGLTPSLFGSSADAFAAGVHHLKYYPFEDTDTIVTLTQGSKLVTVTAGTAPNAWNAGYLGIVFGVIDGSNIVHRIDRTETVGATTFYLEEEWAGATVTLQAVKIAPEADLKVLVLEAANECVVERIGALAESCACNVDEENTLMHAVMQLRAAQANFNADDFRGAHNKTLGVYTSCTDCQTTCSCS